MEGVFCCICLMQLMKEISSDLTDVNRTECVSMGITGCHANRYLAQSVLHFSVQICMCSGICMLCMQIYSNTNVKVTNTFR